MYIWDHQNVIGSQRLSELHSLDSHLIVSFLYTNLNQYTVTLGTEVGRKIPFEGRAFFVLMLFLRASMLALIHLKRKGTFIP